MRLKSPTQLLVLALLTALACVALPGASSAAARTPRSRSDPPRTDRLVAEPQRAVRGLDSHNSTGIVAGLLLPNGRTRFFAHGRGAAGNRLAAGSVLEIGSITKVLTGTLLADMAQRGEVGLDEPVATLMPASVAVPSRNGRQITLADLATHTSGLPRDPTNLAPKDPVQPYADYTVDQLYDFHAHPRPGHAVRVLGRRHRPSRPRALALRAGRGYEQPVRERILDPIGMRSTAITLTPSWRGRFVPGHNIFGSRRAMTIARTPRRNAEPGDRTGLSWIRAT
jgi:serine-type D-Ala-D-Ala carboxypeptidase/endopeptidase